MTRPRPYTEIRGFTLVETLVVIAIVTALATFGFSAARSLREGARLALCSSNMRSIGGAMQLFAADNQGFYPDTSHTKSAEEAWIYQLEEYIGEFNETRICPADPLAERRRKNKSSSYILNSSVFVPPVDAFGEPTGSARNKPSLLPDPARTILVFIASDRAGLQPGDDHTHSDKWRGWSVVLRDISPDRHKFRPTKNSTGGCSNYLYADGHVQTISANEVKNKIDKGNNIGAIPGLAK